MLSLIDVKCPHCGALGQILLPGVGTIIVGPCPECSELVMVFCGRVLPLDKATVEKGTREEKRMHLMAVLTKFMEGRVTKLVKNLDEREGVEIDTDFETELAFEEAIADSAPLAAPEDGSPLIDQEEVDEFVNIDLKLLDNNDYFKKIFG